MKDKLSPEEYKRYLKWKKIAKKAQKRLDRRRANKKMNMFFSSMVRGKRNA